MLELTLDFEASRVEQALEPGLGMDSEALRTELVLELRQALDISRTELELESVLELRRVWEVPRMGLGLEWTSYVPGVEWEQKPDAELDLYARVKDFLIS